MPVDSRSNFQAALRDGAGRFAPRGLEYLFFLVSAMARKGALPAAGSLPAIGSLPTAVARDVTPAELCLAFRDRASADFGRLAPHVVSRWGLASGGDLGRAVFLMAEKKCFNLKDGETWEEYEAAGDFRFP